MSTTDDTATRETGADRPRLRVMPPAGGYCADGTSEYSSISALSALDAAYFLGQCAA